MFNYYTDLVWAVDKILLTLVLLGGIAVILYSIARELLWRMREAALLKIKRNIYELVLSGKGAAKDASFPQISEITPQQFIDVTTNRNREVVFFNDAEQELLKRCFISPGKLAALEKTALFSWSKWRRVEAILTLGYAHAAASVNTLKKTLNDRDTDIAYFSILALGQIKDISSARALLNFVRKHRPYHHKIFSLLEAFPADICDEVIGLTNSNDPGVRSWAVKLLCHLGATQYIKRIEELLKDASAEVRAASCNCLGSFGKKSSGESIVKCLQDDSWLVRVAGLKALFKVWGKEGLPQIMGMINDASLSVIECLKTLVTENMDICFPYVEKFLLSSDELAKRVAIEALEASGYIVKIFKQILAGPEEKMAGGERMLKGLADSLAYAGIEAALLNLSQDERNRMLNILRKIDEAAAEVLTQNISQQKNRLL